MLDSLRVFRNKQTARKGNISRHENDLTQEDIYWGNWIDDLEQCVTSIKDNNSAFEVFQEWTQEMESTADMETEADSVADQHFKGEI